MKQRCTGPDFSTGYFISLNKLISVVIVYDKDKKEIFLYVDGILFSSHQISFEFKCEKKLDIGRYSENNDEIFNGEILFVNIWDVPLNVKQINYISKLRYEHKPFAPGDIGPYLTIDRRTCFTVCAANPIPGSEDALNPPDECLLGQGGNAGKATEGVTCEELEDDPTYKDLCDNYLPPP